MKKAKILKNTVLFLVSLTSISLISTSIVGTTYLLKQAEDLPSLAFSFADPLVYSEIKDDEGRVLKKLGQDLIKMVPYSKVAPSMTDALLSIEDTNFFDHEGIDLRRIFGSLISNLQGNNTQGASTLTQQVAKNLFLTSEQTLERKTKEILLSLELESIYSKEEILEIYFNEIYFAGTVKGISFASHYFFKKEPSELTILDSALLAALVKSPSIYDPFRHEERAFKRRNVVLDSMVKTGRLSSSLAEQFKLIPLNSQLKKEKEDNTDFKFQTYYDAVYYECQELINKDPYTYPLVIETYLDTHLQDAAEKLVYNSDLLKDPDQEVGFTLVSNADASVKALIGGREVGGLKMFNRATQMKRSPASSIKPILSYALALENFPLNSMSTLYDIETTYPHSSTPIHNADRSYLGAISLLDGLGYSRNTVAVKLLSDVIDKRGESYVSNYLAKINLMDQGPLTYSYALGGMKDGVSPLNLTGAYAMIANSGAYLKPQTIRKITDKNSGAVLYERKLNFEQVIKETAADKLLKTLEEVVDSNYYNIAEAKPNFIKVGAKTGTNAYDYQTRVRFDYPQNADKDSWFAGYSEDYSIAVWSGFDEPVKGKKHYFGYSDARRKVPKRIFKAMLEETSNLHPNLTIKSDLLRVPVVKYAETPFKANYLIPEAYISYPYLEASEVPLFTYPLPDFKYPEESLMEFDDKIVITIPPLSSYQVYQKIYGPMGLRINIGTESYFLKEGTMELSKPYETFEMTCYYSHEFLEKLTGDKRTYSFEGQTGPKGQEEHDGFEL